MDDFLQRRFKLLIETLASRKQTIAFNARRVEPSGRLAKPCLWKTLRPFMFVRVDRTRGPVRPCHHGPRPHWQLLSLFLPRQYGLYTFNRNSSMRFTPFFSHQVYFSELSRLCTRVYCGTMKDVDKKCNRGRQTLRNPDGSENCMKRYNGSRKVSRIVVSNPLTLILSLHLLLESLHGIMSLAQRDVTVESSVGR